MKDIIKLTNEYASNLNCLFFNFDNDLESHYTMFNTMFRESILIKDITHTKYLKSYEVDIIFIRIDDIFNLMSSTEIKTFLQSLRSENELLPIYVINKDLAISNAKKTIYSCFCIDGVLPTPFDVNATYKFLYRVLKKIVIFKDLEQYIATLERELETRSKYEIKANIFKKSSNIDEVKERKEDIRFSQKDKISAVEFMSSLDDTIMDKVEYLNDELNSLIEILYDIDNSDAKGALAFMPSVNIVIQDIYVLVHSIRTFQITARAFGTLNSFLGNLTIEELGDVDKKKMLISMLLAIINDLEKWIDVVFVNQTTEDIHYLDASFASNILEIENIFSENVESDDDDLEFF